MPVLALKVIHTCLGRRMGFLLQPGDKGSRGRRGAAALDQNVVCEVRGQGAVGEWRDMKTTGLRLVGVLAIGGVSVGATLAWFSDQAVSLLRHWLRIG